MFTDIIQYKLAAGVTEEQLREAAADISASWMTQQEGFVSWQINKKEEGYMDIVVWESEEASRKADENMKTLPADNAWFACYDYTSISSKKLYEVFVCKKNEK